MKTRELPPIRLLNEMFTYCPDTGLFANNKTGYVYPPNTATGYVQLRVDGQPYLAHRIAYYLYHGNDPIGIQVDHENQDRSDNRIENLRLLTHRQNQYNSSSKGICQDKRTGKWRATIFENRKQIHLGTFDCPLMARLAYLDKREELFLAA